MRDVAGVLGLYHGMFVHSLHHQQSPRRPLLVVAEPEQPEVSPHPEDGPASPALHHQAAAGHLAHVSCHRDPVTRQSLTVHTPQDHSVLAAGDQLVLSITADVPHSHLALVPLQAGGWRGHTGRPPQLGLARRRRDGEEVTAAPTEGEADCLEAGPCLYRRVKTDGNLTDWFVNMMII